jgi:hypothetical protein
VTGHYQVIVNPHQLASLRRKLQPKQYARILFDIAHKAAKFGASDVRSQHWDIGATTRNTVFENMSFGARVVTRSPGARAVEGGRAAGAAMPPPSALTGWMARHGIPAGLEFVIARAIARRGHRGRFFQKRTKQRIREIELPRLLHDAVREIHLIWRRP